MNIIQGNFNDNYRILSKMLKKIQENSISNKSKDAPLKYKEVVGLLLCCYDFIFTCYGIENDINAKLDVAIALYAKTGQFTHLAILNIDDYILRTATNGSVSHLFFSLRDALKARAKEILKNLDIDNNNNIEFTKDEIKRLYLIADGKWQEVLEHICEIEKIEFEKMLEREKECLQTLEQK